MKLLSTVIKVDLGHGLLDYLGCQHAGDGHCCLPLVFVDLDFLCLYFSADMLSHKVADVLIT